MISCIFIRNNSKRKRKRFGALFSGIRAPHGRRQKRTNWAEGKKGISDIWWHSEKDYFRRVQVGRGKEKFGALIKVQSRDSELGQKGTRELELSFPRENPAVCTVSAHLQSSVNVCTSTHTQCHCQNDPLRTHSSRELWTQSLYLQCQDISGSLSAEANWVPLCNILKKLHHLL